MKSLILVLTSWVQWLSLPSGRVLPRNFLFWRNGWRVNFWHALSISWAPLKTDQLVETTREGFAYEHTEEE